MTIDRFIELCEITFAEGKVAILPKQREIYREKLTQFNETQLDRIFGKVTEIARGFPKIRDIFEAARDSGCLETPSEVFRPHRWQPTDCKLCGGEGRICVVWLVMVEVKNDERREAHALSKIAPYSLSCDSQKFTLAPGEYRSLFRCACMSGDVAGIPKSWPKWSKSKPGVFYR